MHEGGLSSATDAHEAYEDPGAEGSADAPQQLQLALAINLAHIGQTRALHLLQQCSSSQLQQ